MLIILFVALAFCAYWYHTKIQRILSINIPSRKCLFPYLGHGYQKIGLNDKGKIFTEWNASV